MRKTVFKIKAIFLAIVVLVSSNSYAISSHFCGEQLVAISYFGDDVSCAMETTGDDCDDKQTVSKKCCTDVLTLIEGEDLMTTLDVNTNFTQLSFAVIFVASYIDLFQEVVLKKNEVFKDLPPPDTEEDIQVLHQTFLI
ncbi:hypothetical protein AAON49_13400 [Pseudotenacibaculum sp. MALMAid0570]|uniref:HYC_CC_PP family protein n=1 Tax=Pseudotenacibaculum sp. MALMAid0570 TaxID=3143938 RepID=UPI0032DFD0B3